MPPPGLHLNDGFQRCFWSCWIDIQMNMKISGFKSLKAYLDWDFKAFVLYYIYGRVRAIPNYRVNWLYDILQMNSQLLLWSWKDDNCSLVDNLIAKKLILPTFWPDALVLLRARVSWLSFTLTLTQRRTGASGQNVSKISFFAIKLSTREQSASFHALWYSCMHACMLSLNMHGESCTQHIYATN